jgi:hypothetical protein
MDFDEYFLKDVFGISIVADAAFDEPPELKGEIILDLLEGNCLPVAHSY